MLKKLLVSFVFLLSAQAWATTYHLCPDTDSSNTDLNYGTEDGSSEANCYDGFADAATTNVVAPGDTVELHGTFYHERAYAWVSGTADSPIIFQCGTDCLFWYSVNVAGNYTVASSVATPPFSQTTGSSWQLVSGTTNVWKKGEGNGSNLMWVDNALVPNVAVVPATQDEAGALASLTTDNTFTSVTAALDGFNTTLYFKGTLTSNMRVENRSNYLQVDAMGNILVNGKDYITWVTPRIKGFRANVNESGALYIQKCTGCTVESPKIWESGTAIKAQNNTGLTISGSSSEKCDIHHNIFGGINIGGQYEITKNTRAPLLISAISNVAGTTPGGQIDTDADHGLSNGEKVVIQQATGLTALNGVEKTVTVVDANSFTIATDTSAMGTYTASTGIIYVLRTDSGTTVTNCDVYNNGNYPRYGLTSISFVQDADGLGIGYFGGTLTDVTISNNRFWNNGPARNLITGETGDINRGSGVLISTSYTHSVSNLKVIGNDFYNNHRYNLNIDDTISGVVSGNIFRGVVSYDATSAGAGQFRWFPAAGTNPYYVVNNVFDGESGSYGFFPQNSTAATVWTIKNNVFNNLTKSSLAATWHGSLYIFSVNANFSESHNKFVSAPSNNFWKWVNTQYTTAASWASASSQGASDEIIINPGFISSNFPTVETGYCLKKGSVLRRAGAGIDIPVSDWNSRPFYPSDPSIGACEVTSNSEATDRTTAAARTARN